MVPVLVQEVMDTARAQRLPDLIAAWTATGDERRWFAWALRMDLPVLVERPERVLPCLARHCAWLTRSDALLDRRPRRQLGAEAAAAAIAHATEGFTGTPWLRALQPPVLPITSGVIEEYRTDADGTLAFSADGRAIGVIEVREGHSVAWDRHTGRKISVEQARLVRGCGDRTYRAQLVIRHHHLEEEPLLAVAPDGTVATMTGAVIRVWTDGPATRRRGNKNCLGQPYAPRWLKRTGALFSPDNQRVITGSVLCDARSGAAIASLPLTGTNWIEGCPPNGAHHLTNHHVFQFTFTTQIWTSCDGVLRYDRGDGSGIRSTAVDPGRARYACLLEAGRGHADLFVASYPGGEILFEAHSLEGRHLLRWTLAFSPDGTELWWLTADGERWRLPLRSPSVPQPLDDSHTFPPCPLPETFPVQDGILTIDGAAVPCDTGSVVATPDRSRFACTSGLYCLER